jgi:hypothetical protein
VFNGETQIISGNFEHPEEEASTKLEEEIQ